MALGPSAIGSGDAVSGIVKRNYSKDGIVQLQGEEEIIQKDAVFSTPDRIGQDFAQPVILTTENGVSYAARGYVAPIQNSSTFNMEQAIVTAPSILMNSTMDYESAFSAAAAGDQAFDNISRVQLEEMTRSMKKRVEIGCLYGGQFLALIASTASSSSNLVLTVTTGQWSGMWSGAEGTYLDFWQSNGTTQVNTNAPLQIVSVSFSNKTITVSGNSTDLTAIGTYVAAHPNVGGVVFTGTAVSTLGDQEMLGLQTIMTTSGTLFGINNANYSLWTGNTVSVGGALTFAEIQAYDAILKQKGMAKGTLKVLVSPPTWSDLLNNQAALRMYDSSYSMQDLEQGAERLTFAGQTGKLIIESHSYVKEGHAFMYEPSRLKRIGSTDITFGIPGTMDGKVWIQNPTTGAYSYREYTAQQIFVDAPARTFFLSGITN